MAPNASKIEECKTGPIGQAIFAAENGPRFSHDNLNKGTETLRDFCSSSEFEWSNFNFRDQTRRNKQKCREFSHQETVSGLPFLT